MPLGRSSQTRVVACVGATVVALAFFGALGCAPRPAVPPVLAEARRAYAEARGDLTVILRAFERYQVVAAGAPEGPHAAEAAYALGLLALDLHFYAISPLASVPALAAQIAHEVPRVGVPVDALLKFAVRVFTVARDTWRDADRERAERAIELAGIRERAEGELLEIAKGPAANPVARFASLEAAQDREHLFITTSRLPELVERAILLQRATWLTLLRWQDERAGCAVLAFLAKTTLSLPIDPERPAAECRARIGATPDVARARLVRASWVRLEEFVLDRPGSRVVPLARRLLALAPPEAKRPAPAR